MNTSPRSTCKWSKAAALGLLFVALIVRPQTPAQSAPEPPGELPPFLDEFRADTQPLIVAADVSFRSAAGTVRGYLARQDTKEVLPAVLLVPDERGLTDCVKQSARELASLGYVVLAVDRGNRVTPAKRFQGTAAALADEAALADLAAAVRWLRRRPDVLAERVGVVGWSWGADQALALAASTPVQACVACYGSPAAEPALLGGLRTTPLLLIMAGQDEALATFRKALEAGSILHRVRICEGVVPGFMTPPSGKPHTHYDQAAQAWVEIYNFLGKYVEDAPENGAVFRAALRGAEPEKAIATIADLMRAVNEPLGVRGTLIQSLEKPPAGRKAWALVRSHAALVAEAAHLLEHRRPAKGTHGHWLEQARGFAAATAKVVEAADRQDYPSARRALEDVAQRCAVCHKQHR
ncbi:MAG TPA: dienelactone hydrolase family protein [Gemmataceae bacterium]|nr:dienelactone hydrolase family protein [Gemmataceae bacterium]